MIRLRSTPKYGNRKVQIDGYTFDSQAEAQYYLDLKARQQNGEIADLEVHPVFPLLPTFKDSAGITHRGVSYIADFSFYENGNREVLIVCDVKGVETEAFRIKAKLLLLTHAKKGSQPIQLRIVKVER